VVYVITPSDTSFEIKDQQAQTKIAKMYFFIIIEFWMAQN
jgi:hypothetical protein